ncbi:MAG: PepSY domain-containing protein [Gammaproteobacteria bacterium]
MFPALRRCATGACLAILAAVSAPAPGAHAQEPGRESLVREGISEDAAVALVREQTDGKVVRVERKLEGTDLVYRIRVLTPDGRLREYRVDAATGALR